MDFKPHAYQLYCIRRAVNEPELALFLDMGLGKTVITLTAIAELMHNRLAVSRCLVIAPKRVAESTWTAERDRWEHLKHLSINVAVGNEAQRVRAIASPSDIVVINRENVAWFVARYGKGHSFDMLVVDELSSFKSPSSQRFKALKKIRPCFKRVLGLTGTPSPNGFADLWSQLYIIDGGKRLYSTVTAYRTRYFDSDVYRHTLTIKDGAERAITAQISDICVSMKSEGLIDLPAVVVDDVPVLMEDKAMQGYRRLKRDAVLLTGEDYITAPSAAVLAGKLLQFTGGAVYDEGRKVKSVHSAKLEALSETIEQLQGQSVQVFYNYLHELERIKETLKRDHKGLTVRELKTAEDIEAWNRGAVNVLITHPASAGHGLNLQAGGHHVIWYGLPWSLELYQQANKRLHRQGQKHPVIIHRLIAKGTIDERVAQILESKGKSQDSLIEALRYELHGG